MESAKAVSEEGDSIRVFNTTPGFEGDILAEGMASVDVLRGRWEIIQMEVPD
jgi:hypothetical protein